MLIREKLFNEIRYIAFFSPSFRTRKLESIYHRLSEREMALKDLMGRKFDSTADMIRSVEKEIRGFCNLIDIVYERVSTEFSYTLKRNAIQRRTNRFGFIVLITNTQLPGEDVLRIYRDKDRDEKTFSHLKPHLEPFFSRFEEGTRTRLFLTILGYTMVAIIASVCGITCTC